MYSKTTRRRLIAPPSTLSNPAPSKWCRHWRYCTWLLTPHRMFTSYRLPESDFPDIGAFDSKPQPPSQFRKLQNRTIFLDVCYKSYTYHQWDDENWKCKRFESKSCHPLTPFIPPFPSPLHFSVLRPRHQRLQLKSSSSPTPASTSVAKPGGKSCLATQDETYITWTSLSILHLWIVFCHQTIQITNFRKSRPI